MIKMHYFSNKFSKIAKRWRLSAPSVSSSSILVTWSYVICPNCGFPSWLWRNRTSKISYDAISVTSSPSRHQNNVTKNFHFAPLPQSKFLATPVCYTCFCWNA